MVPTTFKRSRIRSFGNVLTDCEIYCLTFKPGAKIMLDVLTEGQMREI